MASMVFASAALKAADNVGAARSSPDYYRKAENHFWKAKSFFTAKRFEEASREAYQARRWAEKAELDAELKALKKGDF